MSAPNLMRTGTARAAFEETAPDPLDLQLQERIRLFNAEPHLIPFARELASWQPGLNAEEAESLFLLLLLSLLTFHQGSTRMPVEGAEAEEHLGGMLRQLLGDDARLGPMRELLSAGRAAALIGEGEDPKPLRFANSNLCLQKMWRLETRFLAALTKRLNPSGAIVPAGLEAALAAVRVHPPVHNGQAISLTDEQAAAVQGAVHGGIALISGGPGTGKTTIVFSILRVLMRLGTKPEEVALAAPTGKGAKRMGDAIAQGLAGLVDPKPEDVALKNLPPPRTLHRLLGYSPSADRFLHHENNRLAERCVIVDEGSMIDLAMMERLLRSVRDDAQLILLGDAEQLPSVDAGAVFRDLVPEDRPSLLGKQAHRLRFSHRMSAADPGGRNIYRVAQKVRSGDAGALFFGSEDDSIRARERVEDLEFSKVEFLRRESAPDCLDDFVDRWHEEQVLRLSGFDELSARDYLWNGNVFEAADLSCLEELFRHFESFRILCFTRVLSSGANRLNQMVHARVRKSSAFGDRFAFLPGEPILMLVNDYGKQLFNGDQGIVLHVRERGRRSQVRAVFRRDGGGFAPYHLDSLQSQVQLAHAMTVHKSQGSEFERVAIVLPEEDLPLNTREILYTALTRSKKGAMILGRQDVLETGVARRIQRFSGLQEAGQAGEAADKRPTGPSRTKRRKPDK